MILDQFKLDGKVAIVTGASRGLGQGMAMGLAEAGAKIVTVDRDPMGSTCALIDGTGEKCVSIQSDLVTQDGIPDIIETAHKAYGRIDILVNNAGIIRRAPLPEFTEKDWDDVININQKSLFSVAGCCEIFD